MTAATHLVTIANADDLRSRIREIAATEPDPARITHQILAALTGAESRVVAAVTLHEFVRRAIAHPAVTPAEAGSRTYETQDGRRTPSRKVAALRDWVAAELGRAVCVISDGDREWKHLGACTAEDLHLLAVERERKAAQVAAEGKKFQLIAEAVEAAGVDTLAELDRPTLEAVLR